MSALRTAANALFIATVVSGLSLAGAAVRADTDITTANSSDDTETDSGDAAATNNGTAFVGHQGGDGETDIEASDIDNDNATNVQEGDNEVEANQSATSESGAAVGGQVIGGVSSGDMTINATNSSTDVEAETGDADSSNDFAAFVGLTAGSDTAVGADITNGDATNVQEGDNDAEVNQASTAVTGDGVAGQVLGAVSAGTTSVTLANTSEDADATSGDSTQEDDAAVFTGLTATGTIDVV
jgi:hypothetical protein